MNFLMANGLVKSGFLAIEDISTNSILIVDVVLSIHISFKGLLKENYNLTLSVCRSMTNTVDVSSS